MKGRKAPVFPNSCLDPSGSGEQGASPSLFSQSWKKWERRIIIDMLERTNWNSNRSAAERFQVPLATLNHKIKRLGIETRRRTTPARGVPPGFSEDSAEFAAGK